MPPLIGTQQYCAWCGKYMGEYRGGDNWGVEGDFSPWTYFCSKLCQTEHDRPLHAERDAEKQQEAEKIRAAEAERQAKIAKIDAEKEHFRPFIEKRLGHPVAFDDIVKHERLGAWTAREERTTEILAALKSLELASGLSFLSLIGNPESAEWQVKDNLWSFAIPEQVAMHTYTKNGSKPGKDTAWTQPDDLLPYQAVSLYLNKPLAGINWNNFVILPDGNVADLSAAREYLNAKDVVFNFDPDTNKWTGKIKKVEKDVSPFVTIIPVYPSGGVYQFDYTTMKAAGRGPAAVPPPLPGASAGASAAPKTPPPLPPKRG